MMCEASVGAMNWNENFPKAQLKKTKQIIFLRSQEKLINCNENQVFTTCFSCLETFVSLETIRSKLVTFFFIAVALDHHIERRLLQPLFLFLSFHDSSAPLSPLAEHSFYSSLLLDFCQGGHKPMICLCIVLSLFLIFFLF